MTQPEIAGPTVQVAGLWRLDHGIVMVRGGSAGGSSWALPGGAAAPGETLAEAVVRSAAEEAGLEALCGPFMGWNEVIEAPEHLLTMYFELVVLESPTLEDDSGWLPEAPSGARVRRIPEWEVSEVPVRSGLAEFLADQGLIDLVV